MSYGSTNLLKMLRSESSSSEAGSAEWRVAVHRLRRQRGFAGAVVAAIPAPTSVKRNRWRFACCLYSEPRRLAETHAAGTFIFGIVAMIPVAIRFAQTLATIGSV